MESYGENLKKRREKKPDTIEFENSDDFDLARVHKMILSGIPIPEHWRPNVETLNFTTGHMVEELPPKGLKVNQFLKFVINPISDISSLIGLFNLRHLDLTGSGISDLTPLENLTRISSLNLENTLVVDLMPLNKLRNLETLNLQGTNVTDLSPLESLSKLHTISVENAVRKRALAKTLKYRRSRVRS